MTHTVKPGDRVKLTIEGTVTDSYGDGQINLDSRDSLSVMTEAGEVYIETEKILAPLVEVIKPPLAEGLYYLATEVPQPPQISLVFKHEGELWYDNLLNVYTPDESFLDRIVPLMVVDATNV